MFDKFLNMSLNWLVFSYYNNYHCYLYKGVVIIIIPLFVVDGS